MKRKWYVVQETCDRGQETCDRGQAFDSAILKTQSRLLNPATESHNWAMTEKEIVLETIRALPGDCSLDEIAERIEFMARSAEGTRSTRQRKEYPARRS